MDVSADGGVFQMKYTLENPVEGEKVSVNCSESWISGIDAANPGVISFKVAVNEADAAREAVVSVSYAGIDPVPSFKVRQAAAEEVPAPEIKIAQAQVSVPAEGASGNVSYEIINPVDGASVTVRCEESWVADLDAATAGKVSFNVAANETDAAREAVVFLDYGEYKALAQFKIAQEGKPAPKEVFAITVSDVTATSFVVNVVPEDKEMDYLLNIIPAKTAEGFTDDDLYNYDVEFYKDMDWGFGWEGVAQEYLVKGETKDKLVENMLSETEYLVYAYGVNPNTIERLTPISRVVVKTLAPVKVEADFKITLSSVDGLQVGINVKTDSYDGRFVAKLFDNVAEGDTEDAVREKIMQKWADDVQLYGWMGYTVEMILSQYTSAGQKDFQETLEPNRTYYVYAFAVDNDALCCSDITLLKLVTDDTTVKQ